MNKYKLFNGESNQKITQDKMLELGLDVDAIEVAKEILTYAADENGSLADYFLDNVSGEKYIFVSEFDTWYFWEGTHWVADKANIFIQDIHVYFAYVTEVLNKYKQTLPSDTDDTEKKRKRISSFTRLCKRTIRNTKEIESNIKAKRSISAAELDTVNALNFTNGTLHLGDLSDTNFVFLPHNPSDLLTICLDFEYDETADCPLTKKFLSEVIVQEPPEDAIEFTDWQVDEDALNLYLEILSTGLTTSAKWQKSAWLQGDGGNGKSVSVEQTARLLGKYASPFDFDRLNKENPGYQLADVKGKRLLFSAEAEEESKLAAGTFKAMVDGSTIHARPIFGEGFDYAGTFTIIWAMNNKPRILSTKNDVWRRMVVVPFNRTIGEGEKDEGLGIKLDAEKSGYMNLLLTSLKRLISNNNKFTYSQMCADAKSKYQEDTNPFILWLNTNTKEAGEDTATWTLGEHLYDNFIKFCEEDNRKTLANTTKTKFGIKMNDAKVAKTKRRGDWDSKNQPRWVYNRNIIPPSERGGKF